MNVCANYADCSTTHVTGCYDGFFSCNGGQYMGCQPVVPGSTCYLDASRLPGQEQNPYIWGTSTILWNGRDDTSVCGSPSPTPAPESPPGELTCRGQNTFSSLTCEEECGTSFHYCYNGVPAVSQPVAVGTRCKTVLVAGEPTGLIVGETSSYCSGITPTPASTGTPAATSTPAATAAGTDCTISGSCILSPGYWHLSAHSAEITIALNNPAAGGLYLPGWTVAQVNAAASDTSNQGLRFFVSMVMNMGHCSGDLAGQIYTGAGPFNGMSFSSIVAALRAAAPNLLSGDDSSTTYSPSLFANSAAKAVMKYAGSDGESPATNGCQFTAPPPNPDRRLTSSQGMSVTFTIRVPTGADAAAYAASVAAALAPSSDGSSALSNELAALGLPAAVSTLVVSSPTTIPQATVAPPASPSPAAVSASSAPAAASASTAPVAASVSSAPIASRSAAPVIDAPASAVPTSDSPNVGAIAGGVVGGVFAAAVLAAAVYVHRSRSAARAASQAPKEASPSKPSRSLRKTSSFSASAPESRAGRVVKAQLPGINSVQDVDVEAPLSSNSNKKFAL